RAVVEGSHRFQRRCSAGSRYRLKTGVAKVTGKRVERCLRNAGEGDRRGYRRERMTDKRRKRSARRRARSNGGRRLPCKIGGGALGAGGRTYERAKAHSAVRLRNSVSSFLKDVNHVFDGSDACDRFGLEGERIRHGAEQLAVDVHWASAH